MRVRIVCGGVARALLILAAVALLAEPALAQARSPFSVGISEGGGSTTGITGWILSQQGYFEHALAAAVRASRVDRWALPWLAGLSFLYGVLHAAGPGHGKAVLASYMVANDRALRRGVVLSFLAALLQAAVAVALVGLLSLVFHATAIGMRQGAALIEKVSYVAVAALGLWLVARKGWAFVAVWRARPRVAARPATSDASIVAFARLTPGGAQAASPYRLGGARPAPALFFCAASEAGHLHSSTCGHAHAIDPDLLGDGFSWREALSTVVAAGARPCSGAILVLVFASAQGIFLAGVAATVAMALGTALTTAALAALAVLAKGVALRLTADGAGRGALVGRGLELAAALLVLGVGLSLLLGVGPLQDLA